MPTSTKAIFNQRYQQHLQHLKLKGLQPKTIDAYSRAIRRIGEGLRLEVGDIDACGIKKRLPRIACATVTPPI